MTLPGVVLVTGTDTGVGKTVVTAALAVALSARGSVAVLKPVQAGPPADIDEVRRLAGLDHVYEGARLEDPLNPTTAARIRGVTLPSYADHAASVHKLAAQYDTVVVEGAGGVLAGLDNDGGTLLDLADELDEPCAAVVVTRAALGTLNHTRLTCAALRAARVPIAGLVIGSWPDQPGLAERCNLEDLPAVTGLPLLGRVPAGAGGLATDEFRAAAPSWLSLSV
jgi:dethiobiotin synthetase